LLPLQGLRIVVTRAANQAEELARPLRDLGAEPILAPMIGIAPPADPEPLRHAAERAAQGGYDWIIFTSANAVSAFVNQLQNPPALSARLAVIGDSTRRAAEKRGLHVSIVPDQYVAESLLAAFEKEDLQGCRILIPSAKETRDVLPVALRQRGAEVNVVEAYRNVLPEHARLRASEVFREPYPDWVTFASSSAVLNLAHIVGTHALQAVKIASIGPITSQTVRELGLTVSAEAQESTIQGLVAALCQAVPA
jgi:uroporphyrinogen-III synthase